MLATGALVGSFAAPPLAAAFFQVPDEPSPASGTAQVVAQGVAEVASGDLRWVVTEQTAPPPANAEPAMGELGFATIDSGVMLVEDLVTGEQQRLPAGEAMLVRPGSEQIRTALGSDPVLYHELILVNAAAEPASGSVLYSGEPFAGPGARHDLDLLGDTLAPGAQSVVPAGALPTLVLILSGSADVTTETGDVVSLGADEAIAMSGSLVMTAGESGAELAAVYVGPSVPRIAQSAQSAPAATPASAPRVIQSPEDEDDEASPAATPAPTAVVEQPADVVADEAEETDADGDGLTDVEEAELNTDPALSDTDGDGLTDGQESLETGTSPLAPDSDSDGVLDGDEVAQGTDPLDGIAAEAPAAAEEPAPAEEAPAAIEASAAAATPGDSDGDGLEDAIEFELGTDPFDGDTDDDGLTDGDEYYVNQTGTRNPDTDGDGVLDGDEVANGTNPNDPSSF